MEAQRVKICHRCRVGNAVRLLCRHVSGNWQRVLLKLRDTTPPTALADTAGVNSGRSTIAMLTNLFKYNEKSR